jgi:hypothetical protein
MEPAVVNMLQPGTTLDPSLAGQLRRVARRLRGYVLLEGVAWFVSFLLLAALAQFVLDYGTRGLQWSMRAALLAALAVVMLWVLWRRVLWPLSVPVGAPEIAALLERRNPGLASSLISAVRFSRGEIGPEAANSRVLAARTVTRTASLLAGIDFDAVLNATRARRSAFSIIGVVMVALGATLAAPDVTSMWFARNVLLQDVPWPKQTRLVLDLPDGELVAARGDDVVIEASAEGVEPRVVEVFLQTLSGNRARETMATVGSPGAYRYRYTLRNAQEDMTFYLRGGDDETGFFTLRLVDRPRVARSQMHIEPPAYTRLAPVTLGPEQRAAEVLPGTLITIRMEASKPVVRATLMAGHDRIAEGAPQYDPAGAGGEGGQIGAADRFTVGLTPDVTRTYHFELLDELGLENRQPVRFSIKVVPDDPPRVRLKLVGPGDMVTPEAILPIEVEFADPYGLATAALIYHQSRESMEEGSIALPSFRPGQGNFSTSINWPLAAAGAAAGDNLTFFVQATDLDDVSGPNMAQSPEVMLRVVTKEELLADLARREQEYRIDFERLVDAQEQVRGQLLSVRGEFQRSESADQLGANLAPLERRQRNIAGSVNVLRQQFEQILTELRISQLATVAVEQRLGEGIIEPLTQLAKRDLVIAADTLRQWGRDRSAELASQVDPQQVAILSQMRVILGNMLEWEGYQEAVSMLRDILRLQAELRDETKKNLQERASDVFDN